MNDESHSNPEQIDPSHLSPFPRHQNTLDDNQLRRVRLIRAASWHVYPQTMAFWVDGFQRDAKPDKEISWWEHVTACYLEFEAMHRPEQGLRGMLFWVMGMLANGTPAEEIQQLGQIDRGSEVGALMIKILRRTLPLNDHHAPTATTLG